MRQLYSNNARTAITVTLTAAGTELTVSDGSVFPAPAANEYFLATLFRVLAGIESGHEVVKCTSRAGNVLTIERSYEGAAASEFAAGSIVALRPTAKTFQVLQDTVITLENTGFNIPARNGVLNQYPVTQGESTRTGMSSTIYTGNGATQSINTGVDMATGDLGGLVWVKNRSAAVQHNLIDSLRGVTNFLKSNETAAEASSGAAGVLSFDTTGITIGNDTSFNGSTNNLVAWSWQTNQKTTGLTNRNKAYTCHYNTDLGFSIVGYEGDGVDGHEIPHHLGVEPELSIFKIRDGVTDWRVQSSLMRQYDFLGLNQTNEATIGSTTKYIPNSESILVGSAPTINNAGLNTISYHFASKAGVSKVGKYIGTGAAGNYVDCGFKVGWVMVKNLTNADSWLIIDTKRGVTKNLYSDLSIAEVTVGAIEAVDDGFVLLTNAGYSNALNDEYLFLAFAETALDGTKQTTDYTYPTTADTLSIAQDTLISFANGFSASGQQDTQEQVGSGVTYTLGAGFENQHLWLYKDKAGSYGVTEYRPLEGITRNDADTWGEESPLDASLRTTAKHFDYESSTGVVSASKDDNAAAFGAFDKGLVSLWQATVTGASWLQYKFNEKRVLKSWRLRSANSILTRDPRRFTIEGSNDGFNWTAIDSTYTASDYTAAGLSLWGDLQDTSANTTAYLYHRINITANNGDATYTAIAELEFNTILPSDCYLVNDGVMVEYLGDELVTNGTFNTDTDWTKGTGWTISAGVASKTAGLQSNLENIGVVTAGNTYQVTFTVSNYSAGSVVPYVGAFGTARAGNGTYTETITAGASLIAIQGDGAFIGSIDNVSVKQVDAPIERTYLAELQTNDDGEVSWYRNLPIAKQRFNEVEIHNDLTVRGEISNPSVATAWVNFDGTVNPPLIRDSLNVKDVVDLGAGNYEIHFERELDNEGYSTTGGSVAGNNRPFSNSTAMCRLITQNTSFVNTDYTVNTITVHGGKD